MLWDRGKWIPEVDNVDKALQEGELKFALEGFKLRGSWVLVRTGGRGANGQSRAWLLIKHRDQWAGDVDVTTLDKSVKSFGDYADILAEDNPNVWESHRPASGGEAGALLKEIIEKAARIKLERERKRRKPKKRSTAR
jgi:bifunctional non-homologous end joining protein LigD